MARPTSRHLLGLLVLTYAGHGLTAQPDWQQVGSAHPCEGLWQAAAAFDGARARVVLFGGHAGGPNGRSSDTWEWDGAMWVLRNPQKRPWARDEHAIAYDAARRCCVVFGGHSGTTLLADTWEWDGDDWLERSSTQRPGPRIQHAMAYDSRRGQVVLYGGLNGPETFSDTWEWDGSTWVQRSPAASPGPKYGHAMAYDVSRGVTVLFGGVQGLSETWEWDGENWSRRRPQTSPPGRFDHAMAYYHDIEHVVLFGGLYANTEVGDTWVWDGSEWQQRALTGGPHSRAGHVLSADGPTGVVTCGGYSYSTIHLPYIWKYAGGVSGQVLSFGAGCEGAEGTPSLTSTTAGARVWVGEASTATLSGIPSNLFSLAIGMLGFSDKLMGSISLPLDLDVIGMPGCQLLVSIDAVYSLPKSGSSASWHFLVPRLATLVGQSFYQQCLVLDRTANPFGATASNALVSTMGVR